MNRMFGTGLEEAKPNTAKAKQHRNKRAKKTKSKPVCKEKVKEQSTSRTAHTLYSTEQF